MGAAAAAAAADLLPPGPLQELTAPLLPCSNGCGDGVSQAEGLTQHTPSEGQVCMAFIRGALSKKEGMLC